MKHTPTPLHIREVNDQGNYMCHTWIYSGKDLIAIVPEKGHALDIVKACNAYEDLHRTLDIIRDERDGLLRKVVVEAREKKAIALCEGGKEKP